jgi:predicted flap endonuclease-1-like 5' DNA nuclease
MSKEAMNTRSKDDFMRLAGIGPELAAFVTEFVEKPDDLASISFKKLRDLENQMDAILSSFGQ